MARSWWWLRGGSAVSVLVIQVPGKKRLPVQDFLRGYRIQAGDRMGGDGCAKICFRRHRSHSHRLLRRVE